MAGVSIGIGYNLFGNDRLSGPLGAANARMRAFSSSLDINAQRMQVATMMGAGLATMIGVKLVGALKKAVGSAASMEDIMLSVQRVGGFTNDQIEKMQRSFLQLSAQLPLSAEELARVGVIAGRLGVKGVEAIQKLAFTSAQLARSTVLTEETAASALARISRLFKLDIVSSANAVSSALVGMATSSTATAEEIADITVRMGGMASVMGISAHQAMALAATMRDAGLRVEMGGSAVMRILTAMTSKQAQFAKIIGVTTDQYRQMFRQDPMGAFVRLLSVIKGIDKMDLANILKGVGLSNVRTSMTVLGLSRQLGTLERNLGNASNMYQQGTKVSESYELMTRSLSAKLSTLAGSIKNIFIITGKFLLPVFRTAVQVGVDLTSVFLYLPRPIHALAAALLLLAGVVGVLLAQAMALKLMTFMLTGSMGAMAGTTGVLSASLGMYKMALVSAGGSIKEMTLEIWKGIAASIRWIALQLVNEKQILRVTIKQFGLAGAYKMVGHRLSKLLVPAKAWIISMWAQAKAAIKAQWGYMKMGAAAVWASLKMVAAAVAAQTGLTIMAGAWGPVLVLLGAFVAVMASVALITKVVLPAIGKLASFLSETLSGAFNILGAAIGVVMELVKAMMVGLKVIIITVLSSLIAAVYLLGIALRAVSFVLTPILKMLTWLLSILRPIIAPLLGIAAAIGLVVGAMWLYNNAGMVYRTMLKGIIKLGLKDYYRRIRGYVLKLKELVLHYKEIALLYWELNLKKAGFRAKLREWAMDIKTYALKVKTFVVDKARWLWGKKDLAMTHLRTAAKWLEIQAELMLGKARYAGIKSAGVVVGVALAAVAAVALAVVVVYKWIQAFRKASNAGKAFMVALLMIGSFVLGPLAGALVPLLMIATAVYVAISLIVNAVRLVTKWVKKLWSNDLLGVKTLWDDIGKAISAIFEPLWEFINGVNEAATEASIMEAILTPVFKAIKWGLDGIMIAVKILGAFLKPIISAVIWSFKALWGVVKDVWGIFTGMFDDILNVATAAITPFIDIIFDLLSAFGVGGGKDGLTGSVMSFASVLGWLVGGVLKMFVYSLKGLVIVIKYLLFPIKVLLQSLAIMLKVGGLILKSLLWPMITAFKVFIAIFGAVISSIIWPFVQLYKVIMWIKNAIFGSSFLHIAEGIAVVMKPIMWLVNAFLKLFGMFKAAKAVIGAVFGALKGAVGFLLSPLKAVGAVAKKVWDGIKDGAAMAWDMAKGTAKKAWGAVKSVGNSIGGFFANRWKAVKEGSKATWNAMAWGATQVDKALGGVGSRTIKTLSKGFTKVKGFAKKAWGAIFGSGFLHIPEGIMATAPYFQMLGSWFNTIGDNANRIKMDAMGGLGIMTVRHEMNRGPVPVRLVTLAPAPMSMPPAAREIIEIRARIPIIIELDGVSIGETMTECKEFEVIRNYREPCRTFTGICK